MYRSLFKSFWVIGLLMFAAAAMLQAQTGGDQHPGHTSEMVMISAEELNWQPGPEGLPPGAEFVVLEGDPAQSGSFTVRAKLPPNYRIPPHTHPKVERVTVLTGKLRLGMGREFNPSRMKDLPAGGFFTMPPGMEHFAETADEETIIQLTGEGPWDIVYISPGDDPRRI